MKRWLHLVRRADDDFVMGLVRWQLEHGGRPTVVIARPDVDGRFPLVTAEPSSAAVGGAGLTAAELIQDIEAHDAVAVW